MLEEICHNVAIKPILQPIVDNNLVSSTTNTNDIARLDVSASWLASGSRDRKYFLMSGRLTPKLQVTDIDVQKSLTNINKTFR